MAARVGGGVSGEGSPREGAAAGTPQAPRRGRHRRRPAGGASVREMTPLVAAVVLVCAVVVAGMVIAYRAYARTLLQSQEQQATTLAQSASRNLESFFDMRLRELDMQFSESAVESATLARGGDFPSAVDSLVSGLGTPDPAVISVKVLKGAEVDDPSAALPEAAGYLEDDANERAFVTQAKSSSKAFLGFWCQQGDGFVAYACRAIRLDGELRGYVVEGVDLNRVYEETLDDLQVGERGYFTVKDPDRVIVMHRLHGQIGLNTDTQRKGVYEQGDWSALDDRQYGDEAGCAIVTSYWWDDMDEGPVRKLIAYAPVYLDGDHFVVNAVVSYDEVMSPLRSVGAICSALGVVMVLVVAAGGWGIAKGVQDGRHLRRELELERDLRSQAQRLRLQERQLQHADRLQTTGLIAGTLAHELKNAMTPLPIYGQMLGADDVSDAERREIAGEIEGLSDRLSAMVSRMLAYVRRGGAPADPSRQAATFDATPVVAQAVDTVRILCPRDVELRAEVSGDPCTLRGDPVSIDQIVLNLVTNALYAMRDGGGTLTVAWGPCPRRRGAFELTVADTGCGMDEATRQRVFTSFFTTKGDEGTGLGMMVVQTLVQGMRGSISVRSRLGEGTTFSVVLPAVSDDDAPDGAGAGSRDGGAGAPGESGTDS